MEPRDQQIFADDFTPGLTFDGPSRVLDETAFAGFARLTGDSHPIHYDRAYAARTQFGRPVAHGLLLMSMTALGAADISLRLREAMIALVDQRSRFLRPVFAGEKVQCRFAVVSVEPKKRRTIAAVRLAVELLNSAGEQVLTGEHTYLLRYRPPKGAKGDEPHDTESA